MTNEATCSGCHQPLRNHQYIDCLEIQNRRLRAEIVRMTNSCTGRHGSQSLCWEQSPSSAGEQP